MTRMKNKQGFTLIEVLVVISVIGLLAVLVMGSYLLQLRKGRDGQVKADLDRMRVAFEEYLTDNDCYPTDVNELSPYLKDVPLDPATDTKLYYDTNDPTCPTWYRFFSQLENDADADKVKLGCQYGCGPNSSLLAYDYYVTSPNAPKPVFASGPVGGPTPPGGGTTPTPGSTPTPGGGGSTYYGCFNGQCLQIVGTLCNPYWTNDPTCGYSPSTGHNLCVNDSGGYQNQCQ